MKKTKKDKPLKKVLKENKKAQKKAENQSRRKERKGHGFWFYFLLLLLFVLISVGGTVAYSIYFCNVESVECTGTSLYSDEEITGFILDDEYSTNSLYVFFKNLIMPVENVPFIERFEVTLKDPHTVAINAVEKTFYGYIPTAKYGYVYYDKEGIVYEVSQALLEGYMRVEGLKVKKPAIGEPLPVGKTNRRTLLAIQEGLEKQQLSVSVITFTEDGTILLTCGDMMINLGTRASITDKIKRLQYVLPYIEGKKGTLHLEEWTQENTDIVFDED